MATKIDMRSTEKPPRRAPDGKRVTFDRGRAKANGDGLPLKTAEVEKE